MACAAVVLGLFGVELFAYMDSPLSSRVDVAADFGEPRLRVNFNLSFPALPCDLASVDLWDKIGQNQVNVTQNVEKWQLAADGRRRAYLGRNRREATLDYDRFHPKLEALHANGVHVSPVTAATWGDFSARHEFALVAFLTPWCDHCKKLAPTLEVLAEELEREEEPFAVGAVDCDENAALCAEHAVRAFPSLRFFHSGAQVDAGEFKFDRTVEALMGFVRKKLQVENINKHYPDRQRSAQARSFWDHQHHASGQERDQPGCLISGFVLLNKVPGNFHVMAHSRNHNLNTLAVNLSHTVHHLSFGDELDAAKRRRLARLPEKHRPRTSPLDGLTFTHDDAHQAFHHYMHVVPTRYSLAKSKKSQIDLHQIVHNSQISIYEPWEPPEARFTYDLAEVAVHVEKTSKSFYQFATACLAVVGGAFATLRLLHDALTSLGL